MTLPWVWRGYLMQWKCTCRPSPMHSVSSPLLFPPLDPSFSYSLSPFLLLFQSVNATFYWSLVFLGLNCKIYGKQSSVFYRFGKCWIYCLDCRKGVSHDTRRKLQSHFHRWWWELNITLKADLSSLCWNIYEGMVKGRFYVWIHISFVGWKMLFFFSLKIRRLNRWVEKPWL